jgi:HAD superfamily hydrolase (TIGR01490 family)
VARVVPRLGRLGAPIGTPRALRLQVGARPYDGNLMQAAFFDLDKTIISRSSSLALSRPLYRAGLVSRTQLLRGAYAQLVYLLVGADEDKMERLKEGMLALTKGWNQEQVETLVREVLFDVIDPYVYQEALDLMALHRSEGRRIYIVSSSPEEVVRPLSQHFGASGVIATRAEIDDDRRYTGELAFYAYGEQKAEAITELAGRLGIDLGASYAYSDSITDVPMLSVVGNPVAVNPDRELRREAEERGWQVRYFRRPVRLRTRIAQAVPPPKPSIAAAAGAAAVAAVLVWVVLRSRTHRVEG